MKISKIIQKNIIALTFLLILILISIFTVTMVVNMQEIPSIPMFYFLLIVGYIIAIVVGLAIYRIILQQRIPTFVKKVREMKKYIKKKKIIEESLLYPSKEEIIINKFGDRWSKIGLSLKDAIDIKSKRKEIT